MAVTEAQARRAAHRLDVTWDAKVKDPRETKNQRHGHHGMLSVLAVAFACGRFSLRWVEDFSEDLPRWTKRRLGIGHRVSDTTLYRVLSAQELAGFRETVRQQVRSLMEQKAIRPRELFRYGVLSIDGKCSWASTGKELEGAKRSEDPTTGLVTSSLTTVRAVLTSSAVRPCLDMEMVPAKSGEAPAFRTLFPRVCGEFGRAIDIVTVDAGITARENAQVVQGCGKHYLMALKGNQQRLHAQVGPLFRSEAQLPRRCADEVRNGARIFRELYTVKFEHRPEEVRFPGAMEVWCVRQFTFPKAGSRAKPATEVRYFVSSMPSGMLSPTEKLTLVRLHWGIENGHH